MPKIEIEIPEELAGFEEVIKRYVEQLRSAMPDTRGGRAVDFAKFERDAEASAAELERESLRRLLQSLDIDAQRVVIGGKAHARVGRYLATYATKAGPVEVTRSLYREQG